MKEVIVGQSRQTRALCDACHMNDDRAEARTSVNRELSMSGAQRRPQRKARFSVMPTLPSISNGDILRSPVGSLLCTLAVLSSLILWGGCQQTAQRATQTTTPQRIISLSPSVTEILYGVGAFDRVVAVSDYCQYPREVERLPRVGGWANPNIERIAALQPDLVIITEVQAPFVRDRLDALGIRTLVVPGQRLDDVFRAMALIGEATGKRKEAEALIAQTRASLEAISQQTRALPRPRVLCIVDRVPGTLRDLYAATEGSFLFELIRIAGGEPIAPPTGAGYGRISKEAVVALDPDVIIDMVQGAQGRLSEDPVAVWRMELPQLKAVREARVHPLRDVSVLHPSQFVGPTARLFAEIIHPEIFRNNPTS